MESEGASLSSNWLCSLCFLNSAFELSSEAVAEVCGTAVRIWGCTEGIAGAADGGSSPD